MTKGWVALVSFLVVASVGCEMGPRSGRGLRLPEGDLDRGAAAFRDLGCVACHDVAGDAASATREGSAVIVTLGGEVTRVETYGELVTSIINPSHDISGRYPRERVAEGDLSKMKNFNEGMTVAQLIDLTAFLQSKYEVRIEPLYYP